MELYAIFETWLLGDGNYPALENGMLVNLSFEIQPAALKKIDHPEPPSFKHLGDAEYEFSGDVLRVYHGEADPLAVIVCGEFSFYVESPQVRGLKQGESVRGAGTLLLDYFIWVEFLDSYPDPPGLFYPLRVTGIRKVRLPDRFVSRSGDIVSYPTRISPAKYGPENVSEVDAILDEEFCHYIVRFSDQDVPDVPLERTFLGSPPPAGD